jgi:hypothetical protein
MTTGELIALVSSIASMISAVATLGLVWLTWRQLPFFRDQLALAEQSRKEAAKLEKERRTLDACSKIYTDPTLFELKKLVYSARIDAVAKRDPSAVKAIRRDIVNLLNYFDAIAVGIEQGVYDEDIVFDLQNVSIVSSVEMFVLKNFELNPSGDIVDPRDFLPLARLAKKFSDRRLALGAPVTYATK